VRLARRGSKAAGAALSGTSLFWLWPVLVAPFIGSFIGVLATRLPVGKPLIWSRSVCDHCGRTLGPLDLVPIASWLAARGRCRTCAKPITALYPALELGALTIALWSATIAEGWVLWITCALGWCLLSLAVIDAREGILPDVLTLPLVPLGLAVAYLEDPSSLVPHAIGAFAGFACFALLRWLYRRLRGRDGLGMGDVKLLAGAGAFVSWEGLPSVVLIGALFGLVTAVITATLGRRMALDQRLAFGPGLCVGFWLVWLYGPLG
jgi:leader peptidase (prepilin peptidase) / N-methyltransferase